MKNYLYQRRKQLALTQKEIAKAIGVSEATVSRYEDGNIANMKRDKIAAYAKILRTTPDFIMNGVEAITPNELKQKEINYDDKKDD